MSDKERSLVLGSQPTALQRARVVDEVLEALAEAVWADVRDALPCQAISVRSVGTRVAEITEAPQ